MGDNILLIAAIVTIVGGSGIIGVTISVLKNKELIKSTLADWTRRGRKVIYFQVSHNKQRDVILHLYLCGEEKSWLFPSYQENCKSYVLAMKIIHYDSSDDSYSYRDRARWEEMIVHSLSEKKIPCLLQLISKYKFRFGFYSDNNELRIVSDSFKFKTELKACLKKYRIKYKRKAAEPIDRWEVTNRYPI